MADSKILQRLDRGYTYMTSEDGVTRVGTVVDVSDVADAVKERRAMGMTEQVFGRHEASIPLETLDAWAKKISNGALNAFDVADDDALLNRFMAEHGCYKVHKGWQ
jgi:arginyl-tRNA synthetase